MTRAYDGLTTKVLNERLIEMIPYGILEKESFPEIPPRVEYRFTEYGEKFVSILESIRQLAKDGPGSIP